MKAVEKIDIPIFFIHGENDYEVPVENVVKLSRQSSNSEDQLWIVPEAGHVEASKVAEEEYITKIVEFFDKIL